MHVLYPSLWHTAVLLLLLSLSLAVLGSEGSMDDPIDTAAILAFLADDDDRAPDSDPNTHLDLTTDNLLNNGSIDYPIGPDALLALLTEDDETPDGGPRPHHDLTAENRAGEPAVQLVESIINLNSHSTVGLAGHAHLETLLNQIKHDLAQLSQALDSHLGLLVPHLSQRGYICREVLSDDLRKLTERCRAIEQKAQVVRELLQNFRKPLLQALGRHSPITVAIMVLNRALACLSAPNLGAILPLEGSLDYFTASLFVRLFQKLFKGFFLIAYSNTILSMRRIQYGWHLTPEVASDIYQRLMEATHCLWEIGLTQRQLMAVFNQHSVDDALLGASAGVLHGLQVLAWVQRLLGGTDRLLKDVAQFPQLSQAGQFLQGTATSILDITGSLTSFRVTNLEILHLLQLDTAVAAGSSDAQLQLRREVHRTRLRLQSLQRGTEGLCASAASIWTIPFDESIVAITGMVLLVARLNIDPVALDLGMGDINAPYRPLGLQPVSELASLLLECISGSVTSDGDVIPRLKPRAEVLRMLLKIAQTMAADFSYRPAVPLFPQQGITTVLPRS